MPSSEGTPLSEGTQKEKKSRAQSLLRPPWPWDMATRSPSTWVASCRVRKVGFYTPGRDEHGPRFNRGSGGGARGCGFEERATCAYRGGSFPIAAAVCVSPLKRQLVFQKKSMGVRLGESRNQLRGAKVGGLAMRGAVPCLSADLTTHAVPHFALQASKNGKACAPQRATRRGDERGKRRHARVLGLPLSWLDCSRPDATFP